MLLGARASCETHATAARDAFCPCRFRVGLLFILLILVYRILWWLLYVSCFAIITLSLYCPLSLRSSTALAPSNHHLSYAMYPNLSPAAHIHHICLRLQLSLLISWDHIRYLYQPHIKRHARLCAGLTRCQCPSVPVSFCTYTHAAHGPL